MKIIIIGGGPGGYTAAFDAADRGHEVVLIEKNSLGGTCLNYGCIPTKTMRSSADALSFAKRLPEFGVLDCAGARADGQAIRGRMDKVIGVLREGLAKSCKARKIGVIHGCGSVIDGRHVKIIGTDESAEETIEGDAIIIAAGSEIAELPGLAFDHEVICDSNDALDLKKIPQRLCIVGGGVIGCELACIYHEFGSDITIIEGQDRLLPMPSIDADISALMAREMKKRKIRIHTGKTLADINIVDGKAVGTIAASPFVKDGAASSAGEITTDMIFVTVGRKPCSGALGQSGIKTDRRGWVEVDKGMATNIAGVYAVGDILGPGHIMLAHVAAMEGLCAVANICGEGWDMPYGVVPSAIFTSPEIGVVGLTEAQARESYGNVVCATVQMRELGKAQAMGELPGFFKLMANGDDGSLLGAQLAGAHASDIVSEATLAMQNKLTVMDIARTIHPHPTLGEGFYEAARIAAAKIGRK